MAQGALMNLLTRSPRLKTLPRPQRKKANWSKKFQGLWKVTKGADEDKWLTGIAKFSNSAPRYLGLDQQLKRSRETWDEPDVVRVFIKQTETSNARFPGVPE